MDTSRRPSTPESSAGPFAIGPRRASIESQTSLANTCRTPHRRQTPSSSSSGLTASTDSARACQREDPAASRGRPLRLADLPLSRSLRDFLQTESGKDLKQALEKVLLPTQPKPGFAEGAHIGLLLSAKEVSQVLGSAYCWEGLARLQALRELLGRKDTRIGRFCAACASKVGESKVVALHGFNWSIKILAGVSLLPALVGATLCGACGAVLGGLSGVVVDSTFGNFMADNESPIDEWASFKMGATSVAETCGLPVAIILGYLPLRAAAATLNRADQALSKHWYQNATRKEGRAWAERVLKRRQAKIRQNA